MSQIKFSRRGRPVAQLPVERVIQIGRKQVGRFPERLDHFVVSHTSPAGDAAGNRAIDEDLCERLLEDQRQYAPDLPPDKLRSIRVFLSPLQGTEEGAFESQFRCRTEDRFVVCRGDGETAEWLRGVDDAGKLRLQPECLRPARNIGREDPAVVVECNGVECPYYARTTPDGKKQIFPRCTAEWTLSVQITILNSVFGIARLRSSSLTGLEETAGVVGALGELVDNGTIPSLSAVPLDLRLKNITTGHSKDGAWTTHLHAPGTALALIEASARAYAEGRQLGAASVPPRPVAYLEAATAEAVEAEAADTEPEPAKAAQQEPLDVTDRENCWDHLRNLAAEIAGDDDVARAALKRVIAEAADLGLPPWRKTDGAIWMMTVGELEHAEEALEEAVVAMATAAAQATAEEATP